MLRTDGTPASPPAARAALAGVLALFFASGFAALVYQVVWQRILTLFSGADVVSVTTIVAAFMAGIGCGSLAGGHVADRLSSAGCLRAFAVVELAIAAFALGSKTILYDLFYLRLGWLAALPGVVQIALFMVLLWPTFFMGMSLPVLAAALGRTLAAAPGRIGGLYAVNTLGAAAGAFVSGWILFGRYGFERSVLVAALCNLAAGLGALALARLLPGGADPRAAAPEPAPEAEPARLRLGAWIALYAVSGFVALSLEIAWFRLLGVLQKSTAFTFPTLLAAYLGAYGAGSAVAIVPARRSRRAAEWFLFLQAAVPILAASGLALLVIAADRVAPLWAYLGQYEPLDAAGAMRDLGRALGGEALDAEVRGRVVRLAIVYFAVPLVLIGPATLLMGASFPFLQKAVQSDAAAVGRRVGWLQAANIAGCVAGAVVTGTVLLDVLGTAGSIRLLAGAGILFPILLLRVLPACRRLWAGAAAAAILAAAAVSPSQASLWAVLHGARPDRILFLEDGSGLSLLRSAAGAPPWRRTIVYAGGIGQSEIPFGGIHTLLGALPALLHPAPRSIAVIGLGSGDTLYSLGCRAETERLTCIEIVGTQVAALERLRALTRYAALDDLARDPRVRHVAADGRAYLRLGAGRYDIIEADALRPNGSHAGNLYSLECFQQWRRQLAPGGFAVSWLPSRRVADTFVKVFPHVICFDQVLIGSEQPIGYDPGVVRARAARARAYYARAGVDIDALVGPYLDQGPWRAGPERDRSLLTDVNTDLFPKDEYAVPWTKE